MLLGTIMNEFRDETAAAAALVQLGDLVLIAEVEAARASHEESTGEYVSGAAQRFAGHASDEDWLALTTALERSTTPAATCLAIMVQWSISQDRRAVGADANASGCACGGGGGNCHENP